MHGIGKDCRPRLFVSNTNIAKDNGLMHTPYQVGRGIDESPRLQANAVVCCSTLQTVGLQ